MADLFQGFVVVGHLEAVKKTLWYSMLHVDHLYDDAFDYNVCAYQAARCCIAGQRHKEPARGGGMASCASDGDATATKPTSALVNVPAGAPAKNHKATRLPRLKGRKPSRHACWHSTHENFGVHAQYRLRSARRRLHLIQVACCQLHICPRSYSLQENARLLLRSLSDTDLYFCHRCRC